MPRPATGRTSWAWILVLLTLALPLSACSDASEPSAAPERVHTAEQVSLAAHPVATRTTIHRVFGRLPDARRKAVRRDVQKVVDRWWEASYLGGPYPRSTFSAAFPGFTRGAERRAREDKTLMSNQGAGPRIDSVTAQHRSVSLDILAVGGHARSVTAHFVLRFRTTGTKEGTTVVRGRLLLTRRSGPWRVFGYDVAKGSRP